MGEEGGEATPAPTTSTTSGAQAVFQTNAWLSAAAVAVYTTKALWVKLREMGFGKGKSAKNENYAQPEEMKNATEVESESESEAESEFDATQQSQGHIRTQVVNVYPI
ncbi:hypothetical protein ACLKA6_006402 [Drosophila palustris]